MCLSILVGISIDYTLHLALGYVETSRELPAAERARMAVTHVGVSIISGAGSTAASGLLLFFSVITFFKLFGYFIFATALLSITVALTLFAAMLFIAGPTADFCHILSGLKCLSRAGPQYENVKDKNHSTSNSKARGCILISAAAVAVAGIIIVAVREATGAAIQEECKPGSIDLKLPRHSVSSKVTSYVCSTITMPNTGGCTYYAQKLEAIVSIPSAHILMLKSLPSAQRCPFTSLICQR